MGEAKSIYTVNQNTNNKFKGETDFISLIRNKNKSITIVDASISSIKKPDRFAQTLVNLEFSNGSIDLDYNYKITLHKNNKKKIYDGKPKKYKWISYTTLKAHFIHKQLYNCFLQCATIKSSCS